MTLVNKVFSENELLTIRTAPFDGRKAIWIPSKDEEASYVMASITGDGKKPGHKAITVDGKDKEMKEDIIEYRNPPKYDLCEDMSNLTYLSEPAVLWNLKDRYQRFLIYTYSGLFCVTVSPYKMLPVYNQNVVAAYKGKRRTEVCFFYFLKLKY